MINKTLIHINTQLIILLNAIIAIGQAGYTLYLPTLPQLNYSFLASNAQLQLTISFYLIGFGISQLIYGPLSDYFGRKKILLIGLVIFILASCASLITTNINIFILFRFIEGSGIGVGAVIARASFADYFEGISLRSALLSVSITTMMTAILAPALGGFLSGWFGWQANFYLLITLSIVIACFFYVKIPETPASIDDRFSIVNIVQNYQHVLSNGYFVLYTSICVIIMASITSFLTIMPFLIYRLNLLTQSQTGLYLAGMCMSFLLGGITNRMFLTSWLNSTIICYSIFGMLSVNLIFPIVFSPSFHTTTFLSVMNLYFFGLIYPSSMIETLSTFRKLAGTAAAVVGSFQMLGAGIATLLVANFIPINFYALVYLFVFMGLMLALVQMSLSYR